MLKMKSTDIRTPTTVAEAEAAVSLCDATIAQVAKDIRAAENVGAPTTAITYVLGHWTVRRAQLVHDLERLRAGDSPETEALREEVAKLTEQVRTLRRASARSVGSVLVAEGMVRREHAEDLQRQLDALVEKNARLSAAMQASEARRLSRSAEPRSAPSDTTVDERLVRERRRSEGARQAQHEATAEGILAIDSMRAVGAELTDEARRFLSREGQLPVGFLDAWRGRREAQRQLRAITEAAEGAA